VDSEAIFGLLGVGVGGGLTLGADWFKTWRGERSPARVAARAVIREFRVIDAQLGQCIEHGYGWPWERFDEYEWPAHEPVLAAAVTDELQWRKLEDVFSVLMILHALGPDLDRDRDHSPGEEETQFQVLVTLREDMTEAGLILGRWAA
jgi:hypothetical protein